MTSGVALGRAVLARARSELAANVASLTLEEALFAAGGHRSVLGVLKHLGGWLHVYRSYAFDADPRHFEDTSWPRGRRDTVETTWEYVEEVVVWVADGLRRWEEALGGLDDEALAQDVPLHWGPRVPLGEVLAMVAHHAAYHTGELNMLLSIARGEAWEHTEEVEENHISTLGHGVRPGWMSDEQAEHHEAALVEAARRRDRQRAVTR